MIRAPTGRNKHSLRAGSLMHERGFVRLPSLLVRAADCFSRVSVLKSCYLILGV